MKRGMDQQGGNVTKPQKRVRPSSTAYYGQVALVERFGAIGGADAGKWLVELDCFSAQWFDQFQADLSDLPDWHQVAPQARSRIVELTLAASDVLNLLRPLGGINAPEEASGRWLVVRLYDDPGVPEGTPVATYLPPPNSADPSLIAIAGQQVDGVRLESVALPSNEALAKLGLLTAMSEQRG